jgi:hypothetical protein
MRDGRYSLMGPAILITVGTIFLIHELRPEYHMGRLWPVILIVIGIIRLLEAGSNVGCAPGPSNAPGNPPAAGGPASSGPAGSSGPSGGAQGSSGS